MTKFNKGDKVRVTDTGYTDKQWIGIEGIVQGPGRFDSQYEVKLTTSPNPRFPVGYLANLGGSLELVEPPFGFKDIQVGDTIRRTQKHSEGATEVREGTVSRVSWYAEAKGYILAYDTDTAGKENVTLELLNRPEPEPVKARWETAQKGDWLITEGKNGVKRVHTKKKDGDWASVILNRTLDGKPSVGFTRSTESLRNFLKHQTIGEPVLIKG